jgi:type I restriction enzyme M protein
MTMLHQIKTWLRALSFVPTGDELGWIFTAPGGCAISVSILLASPENSLISYGPKLKVWNKGVVNFARPENWVVLDCVVRLLSKGYAPECIELERSWASGHGTSGRLDVLLTQGTGTSRKCFAMIECKCWGAEYNYERSEMLKDGGQLFSYAIQEASTKYLVLYASTMGPGASIKYLAEQVHYGALSGTNQEELHTSWDKSFQLGGLLGDSATPYLSPHKNLKKKDLIELDHDSGSSLFNSFAEILRRHAISDKSNAFNKIFNLFVCKICDEDYKGANDELDFQWKGVDSSKELVETRLPALYKKGLKEYLQIEVNESYFSPLAEFAFIDTYDVKSYEGNAAIIREVVELLQPYQLKYTQKHQFLGDFFEDLLNSGIKQEAGQFFTPTIIARFFLKSIPIHSLVQNRIDEGESDVLPSIIDFSCGAGHFLTEAIDEVQEKIDCIDTNTLVGHHQKRFISIKDNFYWAKEYVYGIEKDYRLAKTTKIAMFLYGDGDAIIVNGDGLDDFKASKTFQGLLKSTDEYSQLEKFDVVVSNPPFSISGFKADVASVDQNFELAAHVGLSSSEIECLFIERAAQLLRPGGYMGLILPLSILNNQHAVYREARKLLLIQFEVCGLVELRDKTF